MNRETTQRKDKKMKAWKLHQINSIKQEETKVPELRDGEVLVAVKAAGICGSDIPRIYRDGAHQMPLVPGHEFSGEVVQVGKWVDESWLHKRVGVYPLIPCHECSSCRKGYFEMCKQYSYLGSRQDGGFAEFVAVPERNLIELPDAVTYEQAAMLEPMAVAVHAMHRVSMSQNSTIVVYGLGTIGLLLTMFLLEKGIENIYVIGNKPMQKEFVKNLGIAEKRYCDAYQMNIEEWLNGLTNGNGADIVFECIGKNESFAKSIELVAAGGKVCVMGNPDTDMNLDKFVYWKILRNQLTLVGTWNSAFFIREDAYDVEGCFRDASDWEYVLSKLEQKRICPEKLITHQFSFDELEQGLELMRDKKETYIKVMIINS